MFLKLKVEGVEKLRDEIPSFLVKLDKNVPEALEAAALQVEADAVDMAPAYTGEYRLKLRAKFPTPFTAEIGSDAPHSPFVELDTRPHFPPLLPLVEYAHLKLGLPYGRGSKGKKDTAERVGFLIARKISRVGTKGQHILARAADKNIDNIERLFIKAVEDSIKE